MPIRGFHIPEGKKYRGKRRRPRGKRALAATGLAATMAATGLAAAPASASGSSTIYACYSDKTKALYYSKPSAKCGTGFTRISWNTQGPQGPQGARGAQGAQGHQGAQGAAGAVAGYTKRNDGSFPLSATSSSRGISKVVASVIPTASASYAVNGMAVGTPGSKGDFVCVDKAFNANKMLLGSTDEASTTFGGFTTLATNGILHGGLSSPIEEICKTLATTKNGKVTRAALTAVQLSTGHGGNAPLRRPRNRISGPK